VLSDGVNRPQTSKKEMMLMRSDVAIGTGLSDVGLNSNNSYKPLMLNANNITNIHKRYLNLKRVSESIDHSYLRIISVSL
jgi:hypothetical protein